MKPETGQQSARVPRPAGDPTHLAPEAALTGRLEGAEKPAPSPRHSHAAARAAQTPPPKRQSTGSSQRVEQLLQLEEAFRSAETISALWYQLANASRRIVPYGTAIILTSDEVRLLRKNAQYRVSAAANVQVVDRTAPLMRAFERVVNEVEQPLVEGSFELDAQLGREGLVAIGMAPGEYPFQHCHLIPVIERGLGLGAIVFARKAPFAPGEIAGLQRIVRAAAHAWWAMGGARQARASGWLTLGMRVAGLLSLLALFALPVPMTVLAPAEVVGRDPAVVTAPLSASIKKILVAPNQVVSPGTALFELNDTDLRNAFDLAEREVAVAQSKLHTAKQAAFVDPRGKKEVAIAKAELELAERRRDYAAERLSQVVVSASSGGVVLFSSVDDWTGKPVSIGERVMEIADPAQVEIVMALPSNDAVSLPEKAMVRVFLDADPLNPLSAHLSERAYRAEEADGGVLAYEMTAQISEAETIVPRIGLRGTARIIGDQTTLGYWLFRRPLSYLRQLTGV
ncbi:MAG: HlyD family efflux transporter periplasmic adaptor subunit [Neomegalonema sp.]|nr:HlyD family efflux transporter periplasmic adaptor subunit [Neomegalonema sp.]